MTEWTQLARLAAPIKSSLVKKAPEGKYGDYVPHTVVNQKLLAVVGPFDLRCVELMRGDYTYWRKDKQDRNKGEWVTLPNVVTGAIVELACDIDGRKTIVQEAGDCENPSNWQTDGARLKDAMSDGLKRCAMRLGVGIHLYAKEPGEFFIYDYLRPKDDTPEPQSNGKTETRREGLATAKAALQGQLGATEQ